MFKHICYYCTLHDKSMSNLYRNFSSLCWNAFILTLVLKSNSKLYMIKGLKMCCLLRPIQTNQEIAAHLNRLCFHLIRMIFKWNLKFSKIKIYIQTSLIFQFSSIKQFENKWYPSFPGVSFVPGSIQVGLKLVQLRTLPRNIGASTTSTTCSHTLTRYYCQMDRGKGKSRKTQIHTTEVYPSHIESK